MQGLINGLSRGDPSKLVQGRAGSDAYSRALALLASVATRFHGDASTLPDGLCANFPDISGSSNSATAAGALRPTATAGALVFAGTHIMTTPSFSMGARASGVIAFRITAANSSLVAFAGLNAHMNFFNLSELYVRRQGAGNIVVPFAQPRTAVLAWSMSSAGVECLLDGVPYSNVVVAAMPPLSAVLTLGDIGGGGVDSLRGDIRGLAVVDATLSTADVLTLSNGFRAKYPI